MNIAIIGGGAAGFFAAANIKGNNITVFEKSARPMEKVRVSGGGRCNITNSEIDLNSLNKYYPRGFKELRQAMNVFGCADTMKWFESRGLKLKTENEGKVFPVSDNSADVIKLLQSSAEKAGAKIIFNKQVSEIIPENGRYILLFKNDERRYEFDKVFVSTGGLNKTGSENIFRNLKHKIVPPVPSLFSVHISDLKLANLPGVSVKDVSLNFKGDKKFYTGSLLITHQGISGPAMLKLSAFKAREFAAADYKTEIVINWVYGTFGNKINNLKEELKKIKMQNLNKTVFSNPQFNIPHRLWEVICMHSGIESDLKFNSFSNNSIYAFAENLSGYEVKSTGRTVNKEEFVTAGGIDLKEIDFRTMESKFHKGLYFCGEVLNIDGITGGYNFQSAWTTAFIASQSV